LWFIPMLCDLPGIIMTKRLESSRDDKLMTALPFNAG